MAKDPAFLMYSSDFLTGTYTMTDEQVGKYIRLLCLQHQKNYLTKEDMDKICGRYDNLIFSKFINEDGKYFNERLKLESEKRNAYCESRRENRLKKNKCKTYAEAYELYIENKDEYTDVNNVIINLFDILENDSKLLLAWQSWKEYKHSQFKFKFKSAQSETTALKNLKTLSNGKQDIAIAIINQSIANGWKGLFGIKQTTNNSEQRFAKRVDYANRHNS